MPLDFPNSPALNEVFTSGTKKWTWTGSYWNASNVTPLAVADSSTIDLNFDTATNTLSANSDYLLSLIQTLSTNMQNIGNYPYLEYACVTTPASAGQIIPADTMTTLRLNTELADTGNFGSLASNQITLSAGTYTYKITCRMFRGLGVSASSGDPAGVLGLYKISPSGWVSREGFTSGDLYGVFYNIEGQFTISSATAFEVRVIANMQQEVFNSGYYYGFGSTADTNSNNDQRTTLRLWKVG